MSDLIFTIRLYLPQILISFFCLALSIGFAIAIRKWEKKESKGKPVKKSAFLICLAPIVGGILLIAADRTEGMSYPTGIALHKDILIIHGIRESTNEKDDGTEITYKTHKLLLLDKKTQKEVKRLSGFQPLYIRGDKMLGFSAGNYQIIDLLTGEVLEILSEDQIKARANASGEKIYSFDLTVGDNAFNVRTVKDKKFTYDPIQNDFNTSESYYPFSKSGKRPDYKSTKHDLFQPELIGATEDGITLVLSFEDLEKEHYQLHAIDAKNNLLWSKWEYEISTELDGESFDSRALYVNAAADEKSMYFVTDDYLVCISLHTGEFQWIISL